MQQQAVNTFSEGINFDLNPITTPNNVLTDCINGTFITFNGDELALQNDAGNTKIQIPNTETYVTLSTGFYPLGMKEYGGVLYIVSTDGTNVEFGSYPSPEASTSNDYQGDSVTYDVFSPLYKYSTINIEEFKSGRYVKFTENVPITDGDINISNYIWDVGLDRAIYQPKFYKVKLYHQLNNGYVDLTNDIWEKFIRAREVGINTYATNAWYKDETYYYYCPSRYKGKLALALEIEDLYKFELNSLPSIALVSNVDPIPNTYKFTLDINALPYNTINIVNNTITVTKETTYIPKVKVELWIDSKKYYYTEIINNAGSIPRASLHNISSSYVIGECVYVVNGSEVLYYKNKTGINSIVTNITNWDPILLSTFVFSIDTLLETYKNEILRYKVTPVLGSGIEEYGEFDPIDNVTRVLPQEFISKYTINGTRLISTVYDDITFKEIVENYSCDNVLHIKTFNEYVLVDTSGQYLDLSLQVQAYPYIFLKDGSSSSFAGTEGVDYFLINEYTVTNSSPVLVAPENAIIDPFILEMFKTWTVQKPDASCSEPPSDYITLSLAFNSFATDATIQVLQTGEPTQNITGISSNTANLTILKDTPTTINIAREGFQSVIITEDTYTNNTTINVAMIATIQWFENIRLDESYEYWIAWFFLSPTIPTNLPITYIVMPSNAGQEYLNLSYSAGVGYDSGSHMILPMAPNTITAELAYGNLLPVTYYNISVESDYRILNDIIIPRTL